MATSKPYVRLVKAYGPPCGPASRSLGSSTHGETQLPPDGPRRRRHRAGRLAARRRLGRGHRGRRAAPSCDAAVDAGRHLHRHRRRLRRRPQRAAHRRVPAGPARTPDSPWPPRWAGGCRRSRRTTRWTTSGRGPTGPGANLGVDTLDLVQLHCPPTPVFAADAVYDALDTLVAEERIAAYGVSVETVRRGADRDRPAGRGERADHPQRVPAQAARARCCRPPPRPGWASSPGCRWPAACSPAGTTSTPPSPPTTTAPTTGTARRSTSARPSPASTSRSGLEAVRRLRPLVPARRHDGAVRAALDHRPARRHRGHPRRPQPGAGAGQRGRRRLAPLPSRRRSTSVAAVYDELIRPQVHDKW